MSWRTRCGEWSGRSSTGRLGNCCRPQTAHSGVLHPGAPGHRVRSGRQPGLGLGRQQLPGPLPGGPPSRDGRVRGGLPGVVRGSGEGAGAALPKTIHTIRPRGAPTAWPSQLGRLFTGVGAEPDRIRTFPRLARSGPAAIVVGHAHADLAHLPGRSTQFSLSPRTSQHPSMHRIHRPGSSGSHRQRAVPATWKS